MTRGHPDCLRWCVFKCVSYLQHQMLGLQVLNLVLRLAWIYTLLKPQKDGLSHNPVDLTFAALEVVRRGHWNFYR